MGMITPAGTAALAPTDGGHMGKGLHVQGSKLTGWGAALAAILNGTAASFDASAYGGVAFFPPPSCADAFFLAFQCHGANRDEMCMPLAEP